MGCKDGIENTIHSCLHPIETLYEMAYGIINIAQLSVQALQEGKALLGDIITDTQKTDQRLKKYYETFQHLRQDLANIPIEQVIRKTTAFLTEAVLLHKTLSALPKVKELAKSSSNKALKLIEQIKEAEQLQVAGTTVSVPFASFFEQMAPEVEATTARIGRKSKAITLGQAETFTPLSQELETLRHTFDNVICGGQTFNHNKLTFNF